MVEIAVYLDGELRCIIKEKWLEEVKRLYPELYPGSKITLARYENIDIPLVNKIGIVGQGLTINGWQWVTNTTVRETR